MAKNNDEILRRVYKDINYSGKKFSKLHKEIIEDFKFAQGNQWNSKDKETLRKQGIKALSINKIKPIIKLITGLERQSRSDWVALPEGEEDELTSDIVTRLLKNVAKVGRADVKLSEQLKHGVIGGLAFLEPYIDYSYNLINGEMKFKKISSLDVFFDPDSTEYDLSDSKFVIKVTRDLVKDDLELLFPDQVKKINRISGGRLNFDTVRELASHVQGLDYPDLNDNNSVYNNDKDDFKEVRYDLIDYYYKSLETRYYVVAAEQGTIKELESKEEAEALAIQVPGAQVVSKKVPMVKLYQVCGNQILYDGVAWCYPRWKSYPIIPYFAELLTEDIGDKELTIQGLVRGLKDLQEEFNKRRTQELRHLNSSANSGFDIEEGQLEPGQEAKLKEFGSSPGVVIKRKRGTPPLTRIVPMPLSQGHAQLAEENAEDLKEASGVNPDLLASSSESQSGRAILLKQRQGLVMVQELLDNFSDTKKILGRFILSQLKELYTVETAMKILGDAFISDNFTVPVNIILKRGLEKVQAGEQPTELEEATMLQYPSVQPDQPIADESGQELQTAVDFDTAIITINNILNNSELGKYDVAIGEGPYNETIRMANFMDLKDLATQGIPIPPNVLIEASLIPEVEKKKILRQLEMQAQLQMQQAQQGAPQE